MSKITQEQIDTIKEEFKKFDADNNGLLTKKEYHIMLQKDSQNIKKNHLKAFFFALKPDANDAIKFEDLIALMESVKNGHTDEFKDKLLKNILLHYDKNNDGQIKLKEFKRIVHDFGITDEGKIIELFEKCDVNKNHQLSSQELLDNLGELFGF